MPTLLSHTHGHHAPHLTYASLRAYDLERTTAVLSDLSALPPLTVRFDALGMFRRSRIWLAPAVTADLVARHQRVVDALGTTGGDLHRNYRPGDWLPHLTLAPRLHLTDLPTVAAAVYDILPLTATMTRAALIDTSTGQHHPLPHLV